VATQAETEAPFRHEPSAGYGLRPRQAEQRSFGRSHKMLIVLDEYTRQGLRAAVSFKIGSTENLKTLNPLLLEHGEPEYLRSDNGPTFIGAHSLAWLTGFRAKRCRRSPGASRENGCNERFIGTLHNEVLNQRSGADRHQSGRQISK
jgi:transposase InsO family protein